MIPQYFKGDETEKKFDQAGRTMLDAASSGLDAFYNGAYQSGDFLLRMYDDGRMPFADRVPRDSFVSFIKEAIARFPSTGTFEAYIFILRSIFGTGSDVLFNIPAPGKVEISVNAASSIEFGFQAARIDGASVVLDDIVDHSGNGIVFGGISGIDSEHELSLLLSEIIPCGIYPDVTIAFFALYSMVDHLDNSIVDHLGNQIVFIET